MSLTRFLIVKLSRVDDDLARRAISTASAQDRNDAPVPREFSRGRGAMAYALALFIRTRPVHFYLGSFGLIAFASYLMIRLGTYLATLMGGAHGW
jgi:hypothetical protein